MWNVLIHRRTDDDIGPKNDPIMRGAGQEKWSRGRLFDSKEVQDVVAQVVKPLKGRHHIFGDSYYGGIKVIVELAKMGHQGTYTCKSDRPGTIFRDYLNDDLTHFGDYKTISGYIKVEAAENAPEIQDEEMEDASDEEDENAADEEAAESEEEAPVDVDDDASEESDGSEADDESEDEAVGDEDEGPTKVPFSAVSFKANRIMNLISTGFSPDATAKHMEREQGETGETKRNLWIPAARAGYLNHMGYIDMVNKELMACRFPHSLARWKVALGIWLIRVLLHNARVVFNKAHTPQIETSEFLTQLCIALSPVSPQQLLQDHPLVSMRRKYGKCFVCKRHGRSSNTTLKCATCNKWIHKGCENDPFHV